MPPVLSHLAVFSQISFTMPKLESLVILATAFLTPVLAFTPGFNYGGEKVRGVNLGGWLVLEVCSNSI